jgi:hypothetical protein
MSAQKIRPAVSLQDRLESGLLTVDEARGLAHRSRTGFYEDARAGLVHISKHKGMSRVTGPNTKDYIKRLAGGN